MASIPDPNLEMLMRAVEVLDPLLDRLVVVGGCATGLLITDPAAPPLRITRDVDLVVDLATLWEYEQLCQEFRRLGLQPDEANGGLICRMRRDDLVVDLMPTKEEILGFANRWFGKAVEDARPYELPNGKQIRLISPPCFLATKLTAIGTRGDRDYLNSKDLEDLVAVMDGRPELVAEVSSASEDLCCFIAEEIGTLLGNPRFIDSLPGHLSPEADRANLVLTRFQALAGEPGARD